MTARPSEASPPAVFPSGQQFAIGIDRVRAVITEVGAGLRSLTWDGQELLDTYAADEMASGGRGQVLAPWPGRVAGGGYSFLNRSHQLPINEIAQQNAIHGLARWLSWIPTRYSQTAVTLACTLHPQPGYPFALRLEEGYAIVGDSLEVTTAARNVGPDPLPYGVGHHPYFTLRTPRVDDMILTIPARSRFPIGARGIPSPPAVTLDGSPFDFRAPRPIGPLVTDECYTDLTAEDGWARVTLTAPGSHLALTVALDANHQFLQVYTGDTLADSARRRGGIAIEPYTCAPNALNNGLGLRVLEPGERWLSTWRIIVSESSHSP